MFLVNGMMKNTLFVIHRSSTNMTSGDVLNTMLWSIEDRSWMERHNQDQGGGHFRFTGVGLDIVNGTSTVHS